MARMKMGGLVGLAALGAGAWFLLRRRVGVAAHPSTAWPTISEMDLGPTAVSADPVTFQQLKSTGVLPASAVQAYLIEGGEARFRIAGKPGHYAVPTADTEIVGPTTAGYGRNVFTAMRDTPSFDNPRPGSLTMMSTPRLPSPRSLSGTGFGQPVSWHAGHLYQPGTHDTSSGVVGLWY